LTALNRLPAEERPRERLLTLGDEALSLTELLAICLGSGTKGTSVLQLAEELLASLGSLARLEEISIPELMQIKGIGEAKAVLIKATVALAKRMRRRVGIAKYPITCPEDAYQFIASYLEGEKREKLALLLRNVKGEMFHHEIIASGTLSEVLVHPREVFHTALIHRAFSIILVHNHPSGNPAPSRIDLDLTRLIKASGEIMGIRVDDHLIIGNGSYTSLFEKNFFKRQKY